jgi:hypothetical protein
MWELSARKEENSFSLPLAVARIYGPLREEMLARFSVSRGERTKKFFLFAQGRKEDNKINIK